jgi:cytochrome c peroxidase
MRARLLRAWLGAGLALAAPAHGHGEAHADANGHTDAATALAPGYGALAFPAPEPGSYALPPLGEAADGRVLTAEAVATTLHEQLGDDVAVLSFVYLSCDDVNGCPLATAVFDRLRHRLAAEPELAGRVRLVSLSFDPARDTPEAIRPQAEAFAGGEVEWRFLTTAGPAELDPILDAYGQSIRRDVDAEGNEVGTFSHVLRVFLIDPRQRIRNIYTPSFLHPETLVADVKTLLLEEAMDERETRVALVAAARRGPGDARDGYESSDYRSRSLDLEARRGEPADLLARLRDAPLGLPPVPAPADNPVTREKIALGRKLCYDRRLSLNATISCAMCHIPEQGFASNELATAVGIEGRTVRRNAPTLYNVAYPERLFHDGRETRLEHQVWGPLLARNEMGNPSVGAVVETLRRASDYHDLFEAAFPGRGPAMETIGMALASYERTLVSGGSPFDRWRYGGDAAALGDAGKRGFALFTGRAGCASCHLVGPDAAFFSDGAFHNTGVGYAASMGVASAQRRIQVAPGVTLEVDRELLASISEPPPSDLGRYEITQDPADRWKYRTPTLRNVALTAPYMHDGTLATLAEVVAFYDRGGVPNPNLDPRVRPLDLTASESEDLVAFLESLTGDDVDVLVADAFAAPVGDVGAETALTGRESAASVP